MMLLMRPSASAAVDCPLVRGPAATTYSRTLHRACLILGGVAQLAVQLQVTEAELRSWLEGEIEPPLEVFLAAVEVLLLGSDVAPRA